MSLRYATDSGRDGLRHFDSGALNEPFSTAELDIPSLAELRDGLLTFELPISPKRRAVPRDLLDSFLALRTADDVRRFASRFGAMHLPVPFELRSEDVGGWIQSNKPRFFKTGELDLLNHINYETRQGGAVFSIWREPVAWWFRFRDRFEHLLAAAVAIRQEQSPAEPLSGLPDPSALTEFLLLKGWNQTPMAQTTRTKPSCGLCKPNTVARDGGLVQQFGIVPSALVVEAARGACCTFILTTTD